MTRPFRSSRPADAGSSADLGARSRRRGRAIYAGGFTPGAAAGDARPASARAQRPSPWPDFARALRTASPCARALPPGRRRTLGRHAGTASFFPLARFSVRSRPADRRRLRRRAASGYGRPSGGRPGAPSREGGTTTNAGSGLPKPLPRPRGPSPPLPLNGWPAAPSAPRRLRRRLARQPPTPADPARPRYGRGRVPAWRSRGAQARP